MSVITIDEIDFAIQSDGETIDLRLTHSELTLLRTALVSASCWSNARADRITSGDTESLLLTAEDHQQVAREYLDLYMGMRSAEEAMRR